MDVEKPNESLESNITIVTTTHPPVLRTNVDNNDNGVTNHSRYSTNQVVIVSNENNKTRVSDERFA